MADPQENEAQQTPAQQPLEFVRDKDEFEALYANNIQAESSFWDLKVIFGILEQSDPQHPKVVQHTSVNLPWAQVKLMSYYLRAAVALHEAQNGKIPIPPSIMPPDPAALEFTATPQLSPELRETISKFYKDFLATL